MIEINILYKLFLLIYYLLLILYTWDSFIYFDGKNFCRVKKHYTYVKTDAC